MNYLLTQEEYNHFKSCEAKAKDSITKEKLQELCSQVADNLPILDLFPEPEPWGCILTTVGENGYCDKCPVQDVCPNPNKQWSK